MPEEDVVAGGDIVAVKALQQDHHQYIPGTFAQNCVQDIAVEDEVAINRMVSFWQ